MARPRPAAGGIEVVRARWPRWAAGVGLVLAGAVLAFAILRPVQVLPRMGPAPPFTLVDQDGRTVQPGDVLAPMTLFSFFPSRGPTAAAGRTALARLAEAVAAAGLAGEVRLVNITPDPGYDTPEVLAGLAAREAAGGPGGVERRWLTGSPLAVKLTVGSGFGVFYTAGDGGADPVRYDPVYVLVDGRGQVRARYPGPDLDTGLVMRDLRLLSREMNARGGGRILYEAAHLFVCYPR